MLASNAFAAGSPKETTLMPPPLLPLPLSGPAPGATLAFAAAEFSVPCSRLGQVTQHLPGAVRRVARCSCFAAAEFSVLRSRLGEITQHLRGGFVLNIAVSCMTRHKDAITGRKTKYLYYCNKRCRNVA